MLKFPANREKNREIRRIRLPPRISAPSRSTNSMGWSKILYSTEQGIFPKEQGIYWREQGFRIEDGAERLPDDIFGMHRLTPAAKRPLHGEIGFLTEIFRPMSIDAGHGVGGVGMADLKPIDAAGVVPPIGRPRMRESPEWKWQ